MPLTASRAVKNILKEATSRDFSGGLNVADSELNLSSKFARVLDNLVVGIDGSVEVRQGTRLFADLSAVSNAPLIGIQFFFTYIIAVNAIGEVFAINGRSQIFVIWNSTLAAAKRPGLTTWGPTVFTAFLEFGGELIVMNGTDKPLLITTALTVDYLADKATGSNINVPVGSIIESYANHVFIASGYTLYVSERNASGTWLGDAGTVFVNTFDMRSYVVTGATNIVALFTFKGFLLVCFREVIVPLQITEDATKTPKLDIAVSQDSVIKSYGAIAPHVGQDLGDQILIADIVGVPSLSLSNFTKILSPDRPSRFVDPLLQPAIGALSLGELNGRIFSIYDRRLSTYTLFLPNADPDQQLHTVGYSYRYVEKLNVQAWSRFVGWNWNAGTRSSEGRVFYCRNNDYKIFVQGDAKNDPIYADYVGEQEEFSDGTTFTDGTGFGPVASVEASGVSIDWAWELPWNDLRHRAMGKTLRYIVLDTEGNQPFTMRVFVDDNYIAPNFGEKFSDGTYFSDGLGFIPLSAPPYTPALTVQLIAKDAGGYGVAPYGPSPYGGGNNTRFRTLTLEPTKFNTFKLRFSGRAHGPLKFVAITLLYQVGTIRRFL